MNKGTVWADQRRSKNLDAVRVNSIIAAVATARDLDKCHKAAQRAERELALAKKLASRIRGK